MGLFDIDNPFFSGVIKIFDCICLSVLWILFSLPLVTVGASSAAMYTTMYKYIRKGEGHLWGTFWGAFRENFGRSTGVWLIALVVQTLLTVDAVVLRSMLIQGKLLGRFYWFVLVLLFVSTAWVTYMVAYSARFDTTVKGTLKTGLYLLLVHPLATVEIVATVLVMLALILVAPGLCAILPSVACLLCSLVVEKVFLQHMSEEDVKRTLGKEDER